VTIEQAPTEGCQNSRGNVITDLGGGRCVSGLKGVLGKVSKPECIAVVPTNEVITKLMRT
jgi:hypothetical protein